MGVFKSFADRLRSYFNPTVSSADKGFWGTKVAQGLGKIQIGIENVNQLPRITLPKPQVQNKFAQGAINLGMAVPESIVNAPRNVLVGGTRIGTELGKGIRGDQVSGRNILTGGLTIGEGLIDAGLPGIGKNFIKEGGKLALKQAVKQGALSGAVVGGLGGASYGLDTQYGKQLNKGELAGNVAGGVLLGGVLGGGTAGAGAVISALSKKYRSLGFEPQVADELAKKHFTRTDNFPVKLNKDQKKVSFEVNKTLGRSPETAVFYDDLKGAINKGLKLPDTELSLGMSTKAIDRSKVLTEIGTQATKGVGKEVPQVFKTEKFNVSKTQEATLKKLQKTLGFDVRKVRSFAEMKADAAILGTTPEKLLNEINTGRITDSEVIALGDAISTSTQRIAKLTGQLKKNPTDIGIQTQLANEESFLNQIIKKRIKGGTEAGRSVVAFKNIANRNLEPAYWLDKAKRQIGENKELPADVVNAVNTYIKNKDRLGLATFISKLGESSGVEKAISLWKAGLLTGFRTHEANIISNTAFGVLENIKDVPATAFDIARSAVTGEPRTKTLSLKQITAQGEGAVRGLDYAKQYIKEGIDPADINKFEVRKPIRFGDSKLGRTAQKYTDTVFGALGAEDKVFREAAVSKSLAEQAAVEGINKKLTAGQIDDLIKNPTEQMLKLATEDAGYATFNKENALSQGISSFKANSSPGVRTATEIVAPFTRTPTNVAEALFDYTPAGFVKDTVKKIINNEAVSDKRLAESFGRSVTGLGLLWAGYKLAEAGKVVGASPASEAQRNQMYLEGKQANSILVNGKWRAVSRVSPVGNLLLLGAQVFQSGGDLAKTTASAAKSLTEQTFLKGVSSGLQALNEPDRFAKSFAENTFAGSVPTLIADVARVTDTVMRDPSNLKERIMNRVPVARQQLPVKLDPLGNKVPQEGGLLGNLFDPFNSKTPTNNPIVNEASRVGYNLNVVGDQIAKETLTPESKRKYQLLAGQEIQRLLPELMQNPIYTGADIDTQNSLFSRMVNKAKENARQMFQDVTFKPSGLTLKTTSKGKIQISEEKQLTTSKATATKKSRTAKSTTKKDLATILKKVSSLKSVTYKLPSTKVAQVKVKPLKLRNFKALTFKGKKMTLKKPKSAILIT